MSARRYTLTGTTGDGTSVLDDMETHHERGYVSLTFYSDSDLTQIAMPTGGTITVTVSEDGNVFGSIPNGSIEANSVGPIGSYQRPNWAGSTTDLKLTFLGITNATYFRCEIARSGGF